MARSASSVTVSVVLLSALLLAVALGLALLGSTVLFPQGGAAVLMVVAAVGFLALQICVFRLFGLRSQADEDPSGEAGLGDGGSGDGAPGEDAADDEDWRAWRG